jgi:ATP-binding cassette subfamily C protein
MTLPDKVVPLSEKEPSSAADKKAFESETFYTPFSEKLIIFDKAIELKDVYYQYPHAKNPVPNGISLIIPKQYSVGLVGPSGAGKTTIIDVIVGLLMPTQGEVLIDGKGVKDNLLHWQRMIGYIPQNIYLSDDTIRRNVAFGLKNEEIDEEQVWSVLISAQLEKFVNSLPKGLDTFIGERGVRLSGGQRQRIGIARSLYHNPEVLVMDEGTASLDNETEWEIMQAVKNLSGRKTLIIVAHRLGTVKNCNQLYFIRNGEVVDYGTYDELIDTCMEFRTMAISRKSK